MIPRDITPKLRQMLESFPIVSLTGSRQSGKTTLLGEAFPDWRMVSLEDEDIRDFARSDPRTFLAEYDDHVIFDEAQRFPDLFSYLQGVVDRRRQRPGQFILSGSQNFLLLRNISQSLAGRAAIMHLLPLSYHEIDGSGQTGPGMDEWLLRGGYPRLYDLPVAPADYFPSYIGTYVERDVRAELGVRKLDDFRRFLALCAIRVGDMLNVASLASECGIDAKTAREWLSILESSFLVFLMYPYHRNFGRRLVKTPKLYFYDTGLAANLMGLESVSDIRTSRYRGGLFENAVVSEILKLYYARGRTPRMYYWRDSSKREIDIIIEKGASPQYGIEVKASATFDSHAFAALTELGDAMGLDAEHRIVVYGGDRRASLGMGELLPARCLSQLKL